MTPYLLAYLVIGALSFLALFILSASARQSVIGFIMEGQVPPSKDGDLRLLPK